METSEQQAKIINLGRQFVNELGLDPGVDTFSKWMAHFIAEKMILIEQLQPSEAKSVVEKECFETILKLWEHRWLLPSGKRPLEDFEPILKILKRLDPENPEPFFHRRFEQDLVDVKHTSHDDKEITDYVAIVIKIDKIARSWIEFALHEAAQKAKSEKTENLLKNMVGLVDGYDVEIIEDLLEDNVFQNKKDDTAKKKSRIEKLNNRIEELNKFSDLNTFILEKYKKELESLG